MISATQLRPGMVIKFNNELYSIFSVNHRTPGQSARVRTGADAQPAQRLDDRTPLLFGGPRGEGAVGRAGNAVSVDDGEYYYFMNTENFEQMHLMKDLLGDATNT